MGWTKEKRVEKGREGLGGVIREAVWSIDGLEGCQPL